MSKRIEISVRYLDDSVIVFQCDRYEFDRAHLFMRDRVYETQVGVLAVEKFEYSHVIPTRNVKYFKIRMIDQESCEHEWGVSYSNEPLIKGQAVQKCNKCGLKP
jgi:hypothetical protein